jgi:hypothetical protein
VVNQNLATKTKEKQPRLGKQGAGNKRFLRLLRLTEDGAQFLKKETKNTCYNVLQVFAYITLFFFIFYILFYSFFLFLFIG